MAGGLTMTNPAKRFSAREFREEIASLGAAFRRQIELEVEAFPADEAARAMRVRAAMNPATGYRFFAETYFPHYLKSPSSRLHALLYEELPFIVSTPKGERRLVVAPRGSAKSTHVSLIFPLWCIITGAKHYIALIMDAFEQAAVMIEALKAELEVNPRLAHDFPDHVGEGRTWREGDIVTVSNVKVEGFGTGKKIRGRRHGPYRPDLAVLDDVENDENIDNPRQRDKLDNWISKAVLELGPPDGSMDVLFAGTILHHDAVIVRFSGRPGWTVHTFRAVLDWPSRMDLWDRFEEIYLNEGEPRADAFYAANAAAMDEGAHLNWPEVHPLLFLMKKRAGNHAAFESEYQNNPISEDNPFQAIQFWVMRREDWLFFGGIDPSLGRQNRHRDPSAILIGALSRETGVLDVVEASIRRRLPDVIMDDAIALQREYNCQLWFVESVQFQELLRTDLMKKAAQAGLAMPCVPIVPIADKNLRIERLQPPFAAGMIRLHVSQTTLITQLQQWPNADHDDGPDCLEMLWTNALAFGGGLSVGEVLKSAEAGGAAPSNVMGGYRL